MEGYSQVGQTTCYSRGTTGYRAPEIIVDDRKLEKAKFSKKSDIWALGCLVYETVFLERAFPSDLTTKHFSISGKLLPVPYSRDINGLQRDAVIWILQATLHCNPLKRISAEVARSYCLVQSDSKVTRLRELGQGCPEPRYSYTGRWLLPSPMYAGFEEDVVFLANNTSDPVDHARRADRLQVEQVIVDKIISHSPSEIADLCEQCMERGTNLGLWLASNLTLPPIERLVIVGLASSPLDFDLFILDQVCPRRLSEFETSRPCDDLLLDLCVGRNEEDLNLLAFEYVQRYGESPQEAWLPKAHRELKKSLEIVLEVVQNLIRMN